MNDAYKNTNDCNPGKKGKVLIVFDDMIADMIGVRKLKVGLSRLRKFFPNLNFLQSCLLKKIPSFVCFVTKIENKWILILQNLSS